MWNDYWDAAFQWELCCKNPKCNSSFCLAFSKYGVVTHPDRDQNKTWSQILKYCRTTANRSLTTQASALPATPKGLLSPDVSFLVLLSRSSMRPTLTIWQTKLIFSRFKSSLPKSWGKKKKYYSSITKTDRPSCWLSFIIYAPSVLMFWYEIKKTAGTINDWLKTLIFGLL